MKTRILAAALWFFAGWYFGATAAFVLGVSGALGPILGTAAAALVAGDPGRFIWVRPASVVDRVPQATGRLPQA